jgi:hypothetical protein
MLHERLEYSSSLKLLDALKSHATNFPDKKALTFLNDKGDVTESYTYLVSESLSLITLGIFVFVVQVPNINNLI